MLRKFKILFEAKPQQQTSESSRILCRTWISKKLLKTMKKNSKLILVARTWREKSNAEVYLPISKKKIYQA